MADDGYSDEGFWEKLKRFAKQAGRQVIEPALTLYRVLQSPDTPAWAKAVIVSALAYFISPVDAIPDVIPVVGYTDDLGALAAALVAVKKYVNPEILAWVAKKLEEWFGKPGDGGDGPDFAGSGAPKKPTPPNLS
jgi:uncharacterized membrane protein YkvA (DUF1232 family)